ncbi:hypothetical protein MATL_G00228490 [Megalops atlanticus]|uniref:Zinc finger and BTB domain-containing protein 12 n=1 Tax=Megalops atlanticus TaxID=7932 RepID=A0A9D3PD09_MEGAT|nr:hypothetical protein MATL_G00228490 [Megalops atlanticus]
MEVLCFRLPGHGDATLRSMNSLRSRQHFCDITIVASGRQTFRGHKVVLAACSPFLRDQFLLNPSSELKVSVLHSATVVCELLQSCYTGILQFSPKEIVNYLTAASYLQMEHVVEKCRGALSQYMQPRTPSSPGTIKSEELQALPEFESGSQPPLRSRSPSGGKLASLQLHSHRSSQTADRQSDAQKDTSPAQDISEVKEAGVSEDFQVDDREDYEVFQVCIEDDDEGVEERREGGAEDEAGEVVVALDGAGCEERGGDGDEGRVRIHLAGEADREGHRVWRRRPWELGGARGRGFRNRRRGSNRERRLLGTPPQEEWHIPTPEEIMGSFGLVHPDVGQEGVGVASAGYPRAEGPQRLTYGVGEARGGDPGAGPSEREESESVAVVGSTSCGVGAASCEHCGLAFPSADALALHTRSAHLLFACPRCGKHFSHAHNLSRHMSVHRGGRSHRCPLCQKTFTQKSTLCDHMNLHSGERPHRCSYCHVRFAHKPALRRHLKEQHGKTTAQNCLEAQREREGEGGGGGV